MPVRRSKRKAAASKEANKSPKVDENVSEDISGQENLTEETSDVEEDAAKVPPPTSSAQDEDTSEESLDKSAVKSPEVSQDSVDKAEAVDEEEDDGVSKGNIQPDDTSESLKPVEQDPADSLEPESVPAAQEPSAEPHQTVLSTEADVAESCDLTTGDIGVDKSQPSQSDQHRIDEGQEDVIMEMGEPENKDIEDKTPGKDDVTITDEKGEQSSGEAAVDSEVKTSKEDDDSKTASEEQTDRVNTKTPESDSFEVLDEIDLTKSDEDDGMEVGEEDEQEPIREYIVPDYDDPSMVELEVDPEQDHSGKVKESKEFLKYWRPVQDNPQEFTSWTYLLQFVEQDGKLPLARRAYNSFFCRYPLCYGYWKKFSELERKNNNILRAQKILERGVRAIPLSIDLWIHVIDFYINHYNRPDAGTEKTRKIFERAIASAGEEFRSEKLWNKFIKWETDSKNWMGVMDIYKKALSTQTQHYSILFTDFKTFINKHSPADLMKSDRFEEMLTNTRSVLAAEALKKAEEKTNDKDGGGESAEAGDEEMDEGPPGVDEFEKPPNEQELKFVRLEIIKEMKKVYDVTEQEVTKIWAFEEGIKRPYFHVKQLERAQLKNWREYLDMEIARENHERIVLLFERCLIACALYEDFWLKYAKYMSKIDTEKAGKIFERACSIHLPKKPNIHVQWSAHEELQGNGQKACQILERLDNILPGMAMIKMRRVAIERRAGNVQASEDLLKSYVASAAKDKEEIFYTRKLAWFLLKISDKKDEAKKLLKELIPKFNTELKLYNDLVEMEFQCAGNGYPSNDTEELMAMEAFDIALDSDKLTEEQKFNFSQRKLEYLEDFGCGVKRLQKVYDEHQKLVRNQKKRVQIDLTVEETPTKKAKLDTSGASSLSASHTSNGSRYTTAVASTATSYATPQAGYAGGDPNLYYQQQQQQSANYWNYPKPGDTQQQQYNYSQWSQYYGQQQHR